MNTRFTYCCAAKALCAVLLLWLALYTSQGQFAVQEPKARVFAYSPVGVWLTVARHNKSDDPDSWHPSFTNIITDYRPVVVKHGQQYEITFRSPNIGEIDLP